jgi:hypothetical protein
MRTRILVMAVVVLAVMLATAWSADITGKWKGEMPGMGGQPMELSFIFKVDGSKLTGTSIGPMGNENPISDGTINGDDIAFVVKVDMQGNEMKFNYKGKISGDEIRLTMSMEGGMGGPPGGGMGGPGGGGRGGMPELVLKRAD